MGQRKIKTVPKYSIVVPFHNEEENVTKLYDRVKGVMEQVGSSFELVFVDDGSRDRTYRLLEEIAAVDSRVLLVKLRRNFGQTSALAAGFDHSSGEYILAMDGDLQHDPAEIPMFLAKLEEGYDVVSGWRAQRADNMVLRRVPSRVANWMMARLSGVDIHDFGTTFKAYRRDVIQNIPLYGEMHRFIPALASWYGASICEVVITNPARESGQEPLWDLADVSGVLRPADDSISAEVHDAAAALLWHVWRVGRVGRRRHCDVAAAAQTVLRQQCDG